jgi:hypothetical protein
MRPRSMIRLRCAILTKSAAAIRNKMQGTSPHAFSARPARTGTLIGYRASGFGTKRAGSRISPRSGAEGRPEVVGAIEKDEIDPT